jgi:inorganic pyrophosphatase
MAGTMDNLMTNAVNLFRDVPLESSTKGVFNAVIEIQREGKNKYEYDKELQIFKLDRVLYGAVFYPTEYGFLPQTWSVKEEDPTDVMVVCTNPTITGCLVEVRPVGIFRMKDRDIEDDKIMAVAARDPRFEHIKTVEDFGPHFKKEIQDFWENYAKLQPTKKIEVLGWGGAKLATDCIAKAHKVYEKTFSTKNGIKA